MLCSLLGFLLVMDWNVSMSIVERTRAISFSDIKIPATSRFSKCEHFERLKKMLHTRNIEACHDLREEDLGKLQHDKVDKHILILSTAIFSIICFWIEILFVIYRLKQRRIQDNCSLRISETFEENVTFWIFKNKSQETRQKNWFSLKLTGWTKQTREFLTTLMLRRTLIKIFYLTFILLL